MTDKLEQLEQKKNDAEKAYEHIKDIKQIWNNVQIWGGVEDAFEPKDIENLKRLLDVKDFNNFMNAYNICIKTEYAKIHDAEMYKKYLEYKKIIENAKDQQLQKLRKKHNNFADTLEDIHNNTFKVYDKAWEEYQKLLTKNK